MTPEEFAAKVREIRDDPGSFRDAEVTHGETDQLMEEVLIELGYEDGVLLIRSMKRWYA